MWKQWTPVACTAETRNQHISFFLSDHSGIVTFVPVFQIFVYLFEIQSTNSKVKQNLWLTWYMHCLGHYRLYSQGFQKSCISFYKGYHHSCKSIYFCFCYVFAIYICRSFCKFFMFCVLFVNKLSFYIYEYCFCLEIVF